MPCLVSDWHTKVFGVSTLLFFSCLALVSGAGNHPSFLKADLKVLYA